MAYIWKLLAYSGAFDLQLRFGAFLLTLTVGAFCVYNQRFSLQWVAASNKHLNGL